jgi:hypothetical protein
MNPYPRMTALARSFPSLHDADGVEPFDAMRLYDWVQGGAATGGNRRAVAFVLLVFNGREWREECPFHLDEAMSVWDREHIAAFLAWARDPWFA